MLQLERFLPGLNHIVCGKPPQTPLTQLKSNLDRYRRSTLSDLIHVFGDWIPQQSLCPKSSGTNSRQRDYSVSVTFWAFLGQVLSPSTACKQVVHRLQSFCSERGMRTPASDNSAYCKARKRLSEQDLDDTHCAVRNKLLARVREDQLWLGHAVRVVDGTGLRLPDTAANQAAFPQPSEQREGCGFPVMKVVACFCLASGTLIDWVQTNLKSHESRVFGQMLHLFNKSEVVLSDRGFCSYINIASLVSRQAHAVMRLHQRRKVDYRTGKKLGKYDSLVTWKKPESCPKRCNPEDWESLPKTLELRVVRIFLNIKGFRVHQYDLVSTLTDANTYTKEALAQLYYRRWAVELYFRDIKTTMGMEKLRCKSPDMVRKELRMFVIAYNLIRALMLQAAGAWNCRVERISFKASVDVTRTFSRALESHRNKPRAQKRIFDEMLWIMASEQVPCRPHRSEPRALKERPKPYPRISTQRDKYVVPKTSRYGKYKTRSKNIN